MAGHGESQGEGGGEWRTVGDSSPLLSCRHLKKKSISCGGQDFKSSPPAVAEGVSRAVLSSAPRTPGPPPAHTLLFIPLDPAISFFGQCCPLGSLWKLGPCVSLPGRGKHSDASNIVGLPPVLQLVMSDSPPGHLPMACLAKLSASFSKTGS